MSPILLTVVAVLGLIGLVTVVARRLGLPGPVLLAVAGIAWSTLPGLPPLAIDPDLVLAIFLPPLLYADAWQASWQDFRRWLRPILSLAIGLVGATIFCVGVVAKWLMPELPWAACFLLGAILSPTDTVAVHAILSHLRVPRRATAILGGESLVNDATGLLGVQLALTVLLTGAFEAGGIALTFVRISGVGIVAGIVVGLLAVAVNARVRGTPLLFLCSVLPPYLAYAAAEAAGASGILAVVVAGFVASWRLDVIAPESRVGLSVGWDIATFALNALMFLFVGLELPHGIGSLSFALTIAATVIVVRLVWFWPAAYIPLWFFPKLRRLEGGYPDPRLVFLGGWCGIRGAVSLAAVLALPKMLPDTSALPGLAHLETAVLVTIAVTLLGQSTTLGPLVRWFRIPSDPTTDDEIRGARESMLAAGVTRLDDFCKEDKCPVAVFHFRDAMNDQLAELRALDDNERQQASQRLQVSRDVHRAVWEAQSAELLRLRDRGSINDAAHQELQFELDREYAEA